MWMPGNGYEDFPETELRKKQTSYVTVGDVTSELTQWPVQLKLVPINAPYWKNASLLVAADCSAFSMGAFHNKMLKNKKLVIACPKLDDTGNYLDKLSAIIKENSLKNITVIYMEVPCCKGLVAITEDALARSGKNIPLKLVKLSLDGNII